MPHAQRLRKPMQWGVILAMAGLSGCAVVTVVDTAVSVTATVVETAVDVTAAVVGGAVDVVSSGSDKASD